ncbi:MAG: hypothetical protein ACO28P_01395 [Ilumatobacteraceae bacterium]
MGTLMQAVTDRLGRAPDQQWLDQASLEAFAYIRLFAPCSRDQWLDWGDLPDDVAAVLVAALSRMADNPRGYRQETIGEYSYTLAGGGASSTGPFSPSEARIIAAVAGCGGSIKTIRVSSPAPLPIDAPELGSGGVADPDNVKPGSGWTFEEPNHSNGFKGRWVHP